MLYVSEHSLGSSLGSQAPEAAVCCRYHRSLRFSCQSELHLSSTLASYGCSSCGERHQQEKVIEAACWSGFLAPFLCSPPGTVQAKHYLLVFTRAGVPKAQNKEVKASSCSTTGMLLSHRTSATHDNHCPRRTCCRPVRLGTAAGKLLYSKPAFHDTEDTFLRSGFSSCGTSEAPASCSGARALNRNVSHGEVFPSSGGNLNSSGSCSPAPVQTARLAFDLRNQISSCDL